MLEADGIRGAGMILSQGLMEELKSNSFERCVQSDHAAGVRLKAIHFLLWTHVI